MRRKIWENLAHSFKEVAEFDRKYCLNLSSQQRLGDMQLLRELYFKMKGIKFKKGERRIQKVVRIIRNGQIIAELV